MPEFKAIVRNLPFNEPDVVTYHPDLRTARDWAEVWFRDAPRAHQNRELNLFVQIYENRPTLIESIRDPHFKSKETSGK